MKVIEIRKINGKPILFERVSPNGKLFGQDNEGKNEAKQIWFEQLKHWGMRLSCKRTGRSEGQAPAHQCKKQCIFLPPSIILYKVQCGYVSNFSIRHSHQEEVLPLHVLTFSRVLQPICRGLDAASVSLRSPQCRSENPEEITLSFDR